MSTRFSLSVEMSRLTRDATAEPVSRDQILRRERGQEKLFFPVGLTTRRIGNLTWLIFTLSLKCNVSCSYYSIRSTRTVRELQYYVALFYKHIEGWLLRGRSQSNRCEN